MPKSDHQNLKPHFDDTKLGGEMNVIEFEVFKFNAAA